jgi:hypothetical protein
MKNVFYEAKPYLLALLGILFLNAKIPPGMWWWINLGGSAVLIMAAAEILRMRAAYRYLQKHK